jgi:hypothetical protein
MNINFAHIAEEKLSDLPTPPSTNYSAWLLLIAFVVVVVLAATSK